MFYLNKFSNQCKNKEESEEMSFTFDKSAGENLCEYHIFNRHSTNGY